LKYTVVRAIVLRYMAVRAWHGMARRGAFE